jgi:hypothetical protein
MTESRCLPRQMRNGLRAHARWFPATLLLLAGGPLGCGANDGGGTLDVGADIFDGENDPARARHCPTGGDPPSPVHVWSDIDADPASTTPREIDVCLNEDIDRLLLRTQVVTNDGPVTSCITREVSRVGRTPLDWAVGTVQTLSLDYPEALPRGTYLENVFVSTEVRYADSLMEDRTARAFKVGTDGVEPSTANAPLATDAPAAVLEPCPDLAEIGRAPNDEVPEGETITLVNFGDWMGVDTIQPLRHEVSAFDERRTRSSRLSFSAWNADGEHLRLEMDYLPEAGVPFQGSAAPGLLLGGIDGFDWTARSGVVVVTDRGGDSLEVRLSDVVLVKNEPVVTRTISDGSIVGSVRRTCRSPSEADVDPTWSAGYCNQIRQVAGF